MRVFSRISPLILLALAAFGTCSVPAAEGQTTLTLRIERPEATENDTVVEGGSVPFAIHTVSGNAAGSDLPVNLSCSGGTAYGRLGGCEVTIPAGSNSAMFDVRIPDDGVDGDDGNLTVRIVDGTGYEPVAEGTENATPVWTNQIIDDEALQLTFSWVSENGGSNHLLHPENSEQQRQVFGFFKIRNNSGHNVSHLAIEDFLTDFIPTKTVGGPPPLYAFDDPAADSKPHRLTNCGSSSSVNLSADDSGRGRIHITGLSAAAGQTCVAQVGFQLRGSADATTGAHSYRFRGVNFHTPGNSPTGFFTRRSNEVILRVRPARGVDTGRPFMRFSEYLGFNNFDNSNHFVIPEDTRGLADIGGIMGRTAYRALLYRTDSPRELASPLNQIVSFICDVVEKTGEGHAVEGVDYTLDGAGYGSNVCVGRHVAFQPLGIYHFGDGSVVSDTLHVDMINDTEVEGDETFTIRMTNVHLVRSQQDGGSDYANAPYTYPDDLSRGAEDFFLTFTIKDNDANEQDGAQRVVMSPNGTHTVDEYSGRVEISVRVPASASETSTVDYEILPGTAASVSDYEGTGGTLNFTRRDREQFISIPIVRDLTDEKINNETFTVRLTNSSDGFFFGDEATLTVTITDSDDPILRFEGPETVREPDNLDGGDEPFGEDYRFSIVNSRGDLVTVAERFSIGYRWTENITAPSGKALAHNDDTTLDLTENPEFAPYVSSTTRDYNLSCFRCSRDINPGVIYDNVSLSNGRVYHDTLVENGSAGNPEELFFYTALWRNGYTGWKFEDADPGNERRKTITTTIIDNDASNHVDFVVRGSSPSLTGSTYAEVNEGDTVHFALDSTLPDITALYNYRLNINETGGDHLPNPTTMFQSGSTVTSFSIATQDDMMDEPYSTAIISIEVSNLPSSFALRNRNRYRPHQRQ